MGFKTLHLELTSRCNLRCRYCAVSQPDYQGEDLEGDPREIVKTARLLGVTEVQLSGHGESTMIPGWDILAEELLKEDLDLFLITNLARPISDREISILARFKGVSVSIDTTNADLFQSLRRGALLRTVLTNTERLTKQGGHVAWSCVVTHRNCSDLEELLRMVLSL